MTASSCGLQLLYLFLRRVCVITGGLSPSLISVGKRDEALVYQRDEALVYLASFMNTVVLFMTNHFPDTKPPHCVTMGMNIPASLYGDSHTHPACSMTQSFSVLFIFHQDLSWMELDLASCILFWI